MIRTHTQPPPAIVPQPQPETPPTKTSPFPPSKELGKLLSQLATEQHAIDQAKADELARLRAIQNRD